MPAVLLKPHRTLSLGRAVGSALRGGHFSAAPAVAGPAVPLVFCGQVATTWTRAFPFAFLPRSQADPLAVTPRPWGGNQ